MGSILPKPVLSKVVERIGSEDVAAACCCINGYRISMEDAHCMTVEPNYFLFGIFDGHSNARCSQFIAENLPDKLRALPQPFTDEGLEQVCIDLDTAYVTTQGDGGTTGTFCIVEKLDSASSKHKVTIVNVGDSRTLVIRDGAIFFATKDHKPYDLQERNRIESAGGIVRMNRVDGDLAVSRAFGDGSFKRPDNSDPRNQRVVAVPDISHLEVEPTDTIILSCDGVFEGQFSNEDVATFFKENSPPPEGDYAVIAAQICNKAVEYGSKDNISCMVVRMESGTEMLKKHGESSFTPGAPYPKNHDSSKAAYTKMAVLANSNLPDALKRRYELFHAFNNNNLDSYPPIDRLAFDLMDDVDVNGEAQFWGKGPSGFSDIGYFVNVAEGMN